MSMTLIILRHATYRLLRDQSNVLAILAYIVLCDGSPVEINSAM